jgi:predicted dehydrogenase
MTQTKIGVIGAGWWATENHIPVLKSFPDVEVSAICALGSEQLQKVQQRFSIPYATEDYRELLAHQDLDGIVVSSPHNFHYSHAVAVLERKLPVLCEKPMALKSSEAAHLVALVEEKGVPLLVPYGWNYTQMAEVSKNAIDRGLIGNIEHVLCHMGSPLRDLLSGTGAWVAENSMLTPGQNTWGNPTTGGGFANGQLTHALGLMYWITGLQPATVFAMVGRSAGGSDLYNAISCRFTNGATGMLGGAGTMPRHSPFQVDIRIFGSRGMIVIDVERPRVEIYCNDGKTFNEITDQKPGAYECINPLKTFVELTRGNPAENRSPAWLGKRVVDTLEAGLLSAETGKTEIISNSQ